MTDGRRFTLFWQFVAIFGSTTLLFAGLSVLIPGPIAVHWNETGAPTGTAVPTWVIGVTILAIMTITTWLYRTSQSAVPALIAEAVFGMLLVICAAASSGAVNIGAVLLAALGAALSYIGIRKVLPSQE